MNTETQEVTETPEVQPKKQTPLEFLQQTFANAPTERQIKAWKDQSPNGRVQMFSPDADNGRIYILRSINGLEEKQIRSLIPQNSSDPETDFQNLVVAKAVVWTSTRPNGILTDVDMRAASAGLAKSMFQLVAQLSDYFEPQQLYQMTVDL